MRKQLGTLAALSAAVLLAACGGGGGDSTSADATWPAAESISAARTRTDAPVQESSQRIDARLQSARGPVEVWVSLDQASVAMMQTALAGTSGLETAKRVNTAAVAGMRQALDNHALAIKAQQSAVAQGLSGLGATELARVSRAHNAIAVRVDASQLQQVASLAGVSRVRPVLNYQLDLSETVPYVGAAATQAAGLDGTGVRVAVLDSGIDYTHKNLGGAGTDEAYAAAYGAATTDPLNTTRDGLFPTAKVVDGFDFVGETWPNCPADNPDCRTEDDDPIDLEGHGTHVADIIGGKSLDGTHKGVAPGASLLAVKVCSAVATSCNGVALLKAMDYSLDPNGDGDLSDAVDVINMSLGSAYGQVEDDLTLASTNAVALGVSVVVSAGNSANRPYIVGSPSIAPGVISVAQTAVPSDVAIPLTVTAPASIAGTYANTQTVDWAPVGAGVSGDVVFYGRGCPAGSVSPTSPDDPVVTDPAGKIALIDRGACSVSLKVERAAKAGAIGVLIGLVAAGDAVSFSNGGGTQFVPTLVIQRSLSSSIKAALASGPVTAGFSTANGISLRGSMAASSSRGPSISFQTIKPEIGAPGASMSAEVGTGTGETAFGGTSGAAPMVSGAAAILLQKHPTRTPEQIKAMLMNSADNVIYTNPALAPGQLAPVTRIGAGEVRVDRAVALNAVAWSRESRSASLSFGQIEVPGNLTLSRKLRVENFGNTEKLFTIASSFRFANDEASGAVRVIAPPRVRVAARGAEDVDVRLVIDAAKLPEWTLNGGSLGGSGALLDGPEYDGYLTLTAGSEKLSVPWHVLPRKAALTSARLIKQDPATSQLQLANLGVEAGDFELFSMTGTSPRLPRADLPNPGDNFAAIDLRAAGVQYYPGAVPEDDVIVFGISTYGRRAHPSFPGGFEVDIDTNNDGVVDYFVYNEDSGGGAPNSATGTSFVWIQKVGSTARDAFFFIDADLNSGNVMLPIPLASLGVTSDTTLNFTVFAYDNYFSGVVSDVIEGNRVTPSKLRFSTVGDPFGRVPAKGRAGVPVRYDATVPATATSELGMLAIYRRNAVFESELITPP